MSFRLVPNSVTLDDLERRNSHIRIVISPNSVSFGKPQHKSWGYDHFWVIFSEVSTLLFRFPHNIDTTMTNYATV